MSWNPGFNNNQVGQGQIPPFTGGIPQWSSLGYLMPPPSYLLAPVPPPVLNPPLMQNPLNPLLVYQTNNYYNQSHLNNLHTANPYFSKLIAGQNNTTRTNTEQAQVPQTTTRSAPPARSKPKVAPEIISIESSEE